MTVSFAALLGYVVVQLAIGFWVSRSVQNERHYLLVSRGMTTLWGLAQMGVALFAAAALERSVIEMVLSIAGFTTGMILGLFLLGRMRKPVTSSAALVGLVVGFLTVLTVRLGTSVAWPWYAPIGTLVTVGVALALDRTVLSHGPPPDRVAEPGVGRPVATLRQPGHDVQDQPNALEQNPAYSPVINSVVADRGVRRLNRRNRIATTTARSGA